MTTRFWKLQYFSAINYSPLQQQPSRMQHTVSIQDDSALFGNFNLTLSVISMFLHAKYKIIIESMAYIEFNFKGVWKQNTFNFAFF